MLIPTNKQDCCGCFACLTRCPKQCITMKEDSEGFLYPFKDINHCINCGLCERVCPKKCHPSHENKKLLVYAAKNPSEDIQYNSSSGGVFSLLAEEMIAIGGVVFGVEWNKEWSTIHSYTKEKEQLFKFRKAKYVQTKPSQSFHIIENLLKNGKNVLFSGLPCQIQGLKLFLNKDYFNLLTIACVCHGVPSETLWNKYLSEQCLKMKKKPSDIIDINLRDKKTGWNNYSCTITFNDGHVFSQKHNDNPWMRAFLYNMTLRPSCHACPAKIENSLADITIGDLWGAKQLIPQENKQDLGLSLVIIHNEKGLSFCQRSNISFLQEFSLSEVVKYNPAIIKSSSRSSKRDVFFAKLNDGESFIPSVQKMTKTPFYLRMKQKLAKIKKIYIP